MASTLGTITIELIATYGDTTTSIGTIGVPITVQHIEREVGDAHITLHPIEGRIGQALKAAGEQLIQETTQGH